MGIYLQILAHQLPVSQVERQTNLFRLELKYHTWLLFSKIKEDKLINEFNNEALLSSPSWTTNRTSMNMVLNQINCENIFILNKIINT